MTDYRIYCINGTHISAAHLAGCENDDAARAQAAVLLSRCGHTAAEVWNLDRFVCRIDRSDIAAPAHARVARPAHAPDRPEHPSLNCRRTTAA